MSRATEPEAGLSPKFVLFGSGLPCAVEQDFMPNLAKELGAVYVSTARAQVAALGEGNRTYEALVKRADKIIAARVLRPLLLGQSVVCDATFSYVKTRNPLIQLAKVNDAKSVGIATITPPAIAKRRAIKWKQEGTLGTPNEAWKKGPLRDIDTIYDRMRHVESSEVDKWMTLDGSMPPAEALEITLAELAEFGISRVVRDTLGE